MSPDKPNQYRILREVENSPDLVRWIQSGGQEPELPRRSFAMRDPSFTDAIVDLYGGHCNG